MAKTIIGADDVINQITETLTQASGEFIEEIANQVLTNKVKYKDDGFFDIFEQEFKKEE